MKQCIQCGTVMEDAERRCPKCGRRAKDAAACFPVGNTVQPVSVVGAGKYGHPVEVKGGLPVNGYGAAALTFSCLGLFLWWTLLPQVIALFLSAAGFVKAPRRCCNFGAVWGVVLGVLEVVLFVCLVIAVYAICQSAGITFSELLERLQAWFSGFAQSAR